MQTVLKSSNTVLTCAAIAVTIIAGITFQFMDTSHRSAPGIADQLSASAAKPIEKSVASKNGPSKSNSSENAFSDLRTRPNAQRTLRKGILV